MNNVTRAVSAHSMALVLVVFANVTSTEVFAINRTNEELEIASWTLTDVTDHYPGIGRRYQDTISTCAEGIEVPGNQNPNLGNQFGLPGSQAPGSAVEPDPFAPPPQNPGVPGYGNGVPGSLPWDAVVNPSIGIGNGGGIGNPDPGAGKDPISRIIGVGIAVDVITNIGRRVWELVSFGKPVAWVSSSVAHGLPKGIKCWSELEGWSWPQSKVYNVLYKNKLGGNAIDYTYRISYIHGGNIEGVGQYLSNVQIVPMNLKVGWGYTFNSRAEVPMVFNVGSKKDPIAAMQVNVRWKVESLVMNSEQSHMFNIGGNNVFKKADQ